MEFEISIVGIRFRISSAYPYIHEYCKGYETVLSECPDIVLRVDSDTLSAYRDEMFKAGDAPKLPRVEPFLIHQWIAEAIVDYGAFLIHGAAVAVDGGAYLFCAPSGTGKTTHIRLWLEHLPEAFVVNGDKPFIKVEESGVMVCGSPWQGKENLGRNCMMPLKAIVFMERGDNNVIREASFSEVFPSLLGQSYRPQSADGMRKTLALLKALQGKVRFYRFTFDNIRDDCFSVAYDALVGGKE